MNNKPSVAYQISRDFSHLYCDIHHLSLSTRVAKEIAVVKVCCKYFKNEVEQALRKKYGEPYLTTHLRIVLPVGITTGANEENGQNEE